MTRWTLTPLLMLFALPTLAADVELSLQGGRAFPSYEQTLRFDPGSITLPGGSVATSSQSFTLDAKGGFGGSASVTLLLADSFGVEGRVDVADVDLESTAAIYAAIIDLPSPLPDARGQLEIGGGLVDLRQLRPVSVNFKYRTPGRVRVSVSAGLSYLPEVSFTAPDAVKLRITDVGGVPQSVDLAGVGLRADAEPSEDSSTSRLGGNAGLGLQFWITDNIAIVGEGRYFLFQEHTLEWRRLDNRLLSEISETLASELEDRLEPVKFNPTFVNATVGVAFAF